MNIDFKSGLYLQLKGNGEAETAEKDGYPQKIKLTKEYEINGKKVGWNFEILEYSDLDYQDQESNGILESPYTGFGYRELEHDYEIMDKI